MSAKNKATAEEALTDLITELYESTEAITFLAEDVKQEIFSSPLRKCVDDDWTIRAAAKMVTLGALVKAIEGIARSIAELDFCEPAQP
ncbi:MAG: hypothetical protein ACYCOY_10050 [Metallibacterium sp.]